MLLLRLRIESVQGQRVKQSRRQRKWGRKSMEFTEQKKKKWKVYEKQSKKDGNEMIFNDFSHNLSLQKLDKKISKAINLVANMSRPRSVFQSNFIKKSSHDTQYPDDFHFHYQKSDNEQVDQLSPTSTCPSEEKSTYWDYDCDQKLVQTELQSSYPSHNDLGNLQGNLLASSLEKYTSAVAEYLREVLDEENEKVTQFILVKEFQGLDLQKQQFTNILSQYQSQNKSTPSPKNNFLLQNSTLKTFMEEITYLNYQQINFELITIISQIYLFKLTGKWENKQIKEFFDSLARNNLLRYINFHFLSQSTENYTPQKPFLRFLENLFQIISELYIHYKVFETEEDDDSPISNSRLHRREVKLFSSQRDIWDSDEQQQFVRLSCPTKKVKFHKD